MGTTNRRFTFRLRYAVMVLLPLMLVLFVAAGMRWATAAHGAKCPDMIRPIGGIAVRKHGCGVLRRASRDQPSGRVGQSWVRDTAAGFWRAWRQLRPRDEIVVKHVTFTGQVTLCTSGCPTGRRSTSARARSSWASRAPQTYRLSGSTTTAISASTEETSLTPLPAVWRVRGSSSMAPAMRMCPGGV